VSGGAALRTALRWGLAQWWAARESAASERDVLYGGATGLRILNFHETAGPTLAQLRRTVAWCQAHAEVATPEDADALLAGTWRDGGRDRVLFTFDDGLASNHQAAELLARAGIRGIFFVVPSLLDRTFAEFVAHHAARGVRAHVPRHAADRGGLSRAQVRELLAMGHRVGAHNDAHRDLGPLHAPEELAYEIGNALAAVAELTGAPCQDFAIGFGQPENLSPEATAFLLARCPRVYACHRGLNVPGRTPRFLLRQAVDPDHPLAFTRVCLSGGADRRLADRAAEMVRRVGTLPPTRATPRPA
jgi:peptidoglycan/xylan/chitin deacetylase (PgdA/CDA1 family)